MTTTMTATGSKLFIRRGENVAVIRPNGEMTPHMVKSDVEVTNHDLYTRECSLYMAGIELGAVTRDGFTMIFDLNQIETVAPPAPAARTCRRCGGSGHYSYCPQYGTTCFGCWGSGVVAPAAPVRNAAPPAPAAPALTYDVPTAVERPVAPRRRAVKIV
jgi:hypothetical protein